MSSWAGIESAPGPEPLPGDPTRTGAGSGEHAVSAARARIAPQPVPRLRRQARPVVGSLDRAGVLLQSNAREVVLGSAWILLPGVVLGLVATTLAFDRYQTLKGAAVSIPELLGGERAATGVEELVWYVGLVVNSLATCLVGGYAAALVRHRQAGVPLRIVGAYRVLVRRVPALTIAWALGHIWFPALLFVLSRTSGSAFGPLAVFGSPLLLALSTFTVMVAPAIVTESLGPIAGLRRAVRMARSTFGLLLAFVVGSVVIGLLVQYGIAYLPRLLQATGLLSLGRFGWLIEGVSGQLGRMIATPLVALATALVYFEVRMHKEGLDITIEAERAFGR